MVATALTPRGCLARPAHLPDVWIRPAFVFFLNLVEFVDFGAPPPFDAFVRPVAYQRRSVCISYNLL
jgi:hypothetical protein